VKRIPVLLIRLVHGMRCMRCGQMGYVEQKSTLCLGCLNVSLLRYVKKLMAAAEKALRMGAK
jgi:hypothetical protein